MSVSDVANYRKWRDEEEAFVAHPQPRPHAVANSLAIVLILTCLLIWLGFFWR